MIGPKMLVRHLGYKQSIRDSSASQSLAPTLYVFVRYSHVSTFRFRFCGVKMENDLNIFLQDLDLWFMVSCCMILRRLFQLHEVMLQSSVCSSYISVRVADKTRGRNKIMIDSEPASD
jgi:hypothetical protein